MYQIDYKSNKETEWKSIRCIDFNDLIKQISFLTRLYPGCEIEVYELTKIYP